MDLEKRFWSKVDIRDNNDCWNWLGGIRGEGYGIFRYKRKTIDSHRFVWFLIKGIFPDLFVCHSCDNRICCNPFHLFLGTSQDNINDMIAKGRRPYRSNTKKLNKTDAIKIRNLYSNGHTELEISEKYDISKSHVSNIINNKTWKE